VTSNEDPVFVSGKSGRLMPDVGAGLHVLECACERKAVRVGKPEKFCMEAILVDHFSD
jgi:ribonucleotide monophosphatase NagD (HAD superfamily)